MWYSNSDDGILNKQIHIDKFLSVEDIFLATRKNLGMCGCRYEFHGPEKAVFSFADASGVHLDVGCRIHASLLDVGDVTKYERKYLDDLYIVFDWVASYHETWDRPEELCSSTCCEMARCCEMSKKSHLSADSRILVLFMHTR